MLSSRPPQTTEVVVLVKVEGTLEELAALFAQGAKEEAENAFASMVDRWLADRDFVTREEFDAVKAMAQKAREENKDLKARIEALESK